MQEKERKPASKAKATIGWAFACLGFLAILAIPVDFLLQVKQNREALAWPTTTGRVMSSEVSEFRGTEDTDFYFHVSYEYQLGGRNLSGSTSLGPWSQGDAKEWVEAYPPGSSVRVYYDPTAPQRSAVWPEVHIKSALIWLVFVFLAPVAPLGLVSLWSWVRKRAQQRSSAPVAGS